MIKRTKIPEKTGSSGKPKKVENTTPQMAAYSALIARLAMMGRLGMSYDDNRNLYQALGYTTTPVVDNYYAQYIRQDIAKAIIDRPIKTTWRGPLELIETNEAEETAFEEAWEELEENLQLKSKLIRLDKLTCLGRYGVLLLGFSDVQKKEDFAKPLEKGKKVTLEYVKAFSEKSATITTYDENPQSPRYGYPLTYTLSTGIEQAVQSIQIHYTRVIHVVQDELDSDIEGTPVLESVFNRLQDLEKLVGGSAEMFWRGARPGYQGKIDPEYTLTPAAEEDLREKIDEYEHNLRRILVNQGIEMSALQTQVSDPTNAVDVQITMISAVTGIPKRILMGSERGELASSQDAEQWNSFIQARREEYAEAKIVRPLVDLLIDLKTLPEPKKGYSVMWHDLYTPSEKDKAEVGKIRAEALSKYTAGMGDSVVPPDAFFEYFLGLNPDQIELINEMRDAQLEEEAQNPVTPEEEELLDEESTVDTEDQSQTEDTETE